MAATPLVAAARIIDLEVGDGSGGAGVVAKTYLLDGLQITRIIDGAGSVNVSFPLVTSFATTLIGAWGGSTYRGSIKAYVLEVVLGCPLLGAPSYLPNPDAADWTKPDTAMWVESGTITLNTDHPMVSLSGKDLFSGFERTYMDRARYISATVDNVLYGTAGTIPVPANSLADPLYTIPRLKGIMQIVPCRASLPGHGRLAFTGEVDSSLTGIRVTHDTFEDSITNNLTLLTRTACGSLALGSSEPLGLHQHWSVDIPNKKVTIGYAGTTPKVTVMVGEARSMNESSGECALDGSSFTIEPTNEQIYAQSGILGGNAATGLPAGSITALEVIHRSGEGGNYSSGAGGPFAWDASLLIVGVSTGNGGGGVFYLVDKSFYPLSQMMDVNDLCYDSNGLKLYAATDLGVLSSNAGQLTDPTGYKPDPWVIVGTAAIPFKKVWVASVPPFSLVLYGVAVDSNGFVGANGVYRYPQLDAEVAFDTSVLSYGGWSKVILGDGSITDAAGNDLAIYYLDTKTPSKVAMYKPTDPTQIQFIDLGNYTGVGLDYMFKAGSTVQKIFVRTSGGALGLFGLYVGGITIVDINSDLSLSDDAGSLAIAKIIPHNQTINDTLVTYLAATDRGLWWTGTGFGQSSTIVPGGGWKPASGSNGITSISPLTAIAGDNLYILGQDAPTVRVWMADANAVYLSNTGGLFFLDVTKQPLDMGLFFYSQAKINDSTRKFANHNIGGLVGPGYADPNGNLSVDGGSGSTEIISIDTAVTPSGGEMYARRADSMNNFTYRYYDSDSLAPFNQYKPAELTELSSDSGSDALTASRTVALENRRFLQQAKTPQTIVTFSTQFSTMESPLRWIRGGDMIAINVTIPMVDSSGVSRNVVSFSNAHFYVMSYTATMAAGAMLVDLKVGTSLAYARSGSGDDVAVLNSVVAGISDSIARDRRTRRMRK